MEKNGQLLTVPVASMPVMQPHDTARVARDLLTGNPQALNALVEQGACDLSYAIAQRSRFRVNIFRQRGTFAVVMRVIATRIPSFTELGLPAVLQDAVRRGRVGRGRRGRVA